MTAEQVKHMGEQFLHILLTTRHVGAIEKSHVAFQILCEHLMISKVKTLYELPAKWIDVLYFVKFM